MELREPLTFLNHKLELIYKINSFHDYNFRLYCEKKERKSLRVSLRYFKIFLYRIHMY